MADNISKGFGRFLCLKDQTAFGTKATGLATTIVPLRGGGIFEPNPFRELREDALSVLPPNSHRYDTPRLVPWSAQVLLVNPTSATPAVRSFLKALFGKETALTGPPITKQYDIYDELIDGGTDGTPANTNYGRALTLHEECQTSAGTKIYADEVQDATVDEVQFIFEPRKPVVMAVRGQACDLQPGATTISPAFPAGSLFTDKHLKNTANSGLRIATANPPTTAGNVIYSRATLTISNSLRYEPYLGSATGIQIAKPTRNSTMSITLDVVMDVKDATSNEWDADDATTAWSADPPTALNIDMLAYIDSSNIFEFKASAATPAAYVNSIRRTAQGFGVMQYTAQLVVAPAALADVFIKLTNAS
jgi:hypothetical protein